MLNYLNAVKLRMLVNLRILCSRGVAFRSRRLLLRPLLMLRLSLPAFWCHC